jgi:hypothetical protein
VKNKYEDLAKKQFPSTQLILSKVTSVEDWESNLQKNFRPDVVTALKEKLNSEPFDLIMLAFGSKEQVVS